MINKSKIKKALEDCDSMAWDECHKIYILMDSTQTNQMIEYGYPQVILSTENKKSDMFNLIEDWFDNSCSLRFIEAITTDEDGKSKFENLISQGEDQYEEMNA